MLLKRHVSKLGQEININQMLRSRLNLHDIYKAARDEAGEGRKESVKLEFFFEDVSVTHKLFQAHVAQ